MKKQLLSVCIYSACAVLLGCSKADLQQPGNETAASGGGTTALTGKSLESALFNSCEFTNYVHATNSMVALMQDPANAIPLSGIAECNYGAYTREEATALLSFTKETGTLLGNMAMQTDAVKSFGYKYKLDAKSNAALWHKVANAHLDFFTNAATTDGQTNNRTSSAVQVFIRETIDCLALRDFPASGEELYLSCQVSAVLVAADVLQGSPGQ